MTAPGKRIVIATHGTLGDLHPYLAIAQELRRRGHAAVIATSEFHRATVERAGIEFRAIRPDIVFEDEKLHRRLTEPRRGLERVIREHMFPVLRSTYEDLREAVHEKGGADLLVSHILMFAAPLVAEKFGIPWVSTELQPGAFMSAHDPPVLAPLPALARLRPLGPAVHRALFGLARLTARSWSGPVRAFRRELGLSRGGDPLFQARHSPDLVLALFSALFGAPQPDWPPNVRTTGFPFYDERGSDLSSEVGDFLAAGPAPVVFTLGSSAVHAAGDFYAESTAAAVRSGVRAVLLVGRHTRVQLPSPLPAGVIAVPYVPFEALFRCASAVVHHGGIGTCAQSLRAGKPVIVVPIGGDQYDNAARLQRLGVGRTIARHRFSAARVSRQLTEILDDGSYATAAAKLAGRLRAEDGVATACDAIDERLGFTNPAPRSTCQS